MTFDQEKLQQLRQKFSDGHGGSIHNPDFRAVADRIFSANGTRAAPFSGISTLPDAPYRAIDADNPDFGDSTWR